MAHDETESFRRSETARINSEAGERAALEERYGQVWSTDEMRAEFSAVGFGSPYIEVVRKSDGQRGSLQFQHSPRFYFDFKTL